MIVGLTGGIGSGKTSASLIFRELAIDVVNADEVARKVVEPGSIALETIHRHFGDQVLYGDHLNRSKLREIIFRSETEKKWLEELLHPIIRDEMFKQLNAAASPYAILEAPLLFENNLEQFCNRTILVDVPTQIQIERASLRDNAPEEQIQSIIQSQMPRVKRLKKADYILDNSGDEDSLKAQVLRLDQILRLMASNSDFL